MRIKEIPMTLGEVPAGGWFKILNATRGVYIRTIVEDGDTAQVVDLEKGYVHDLLKTLKVVQIGGR